MNKIKFSIIMPVYNTEKYILTSLNSVINQTYKNWELIISNDGSTDNSLEICENFKKTYPSLDINIFSHKNKGVYYTYVNALKHIKGDYILRLDSDDYYDINLLDTLYNYLNKFGNADIITFDHTNIGKENSSSTSTNNDNNYTDIKYYNNSISFAKDYFLTKRNTELAFIAFKREFSDIMIKKANLNLNLNLGDDLYLKSCIIFDCKTAILLSNKLYFYRYNSNSITKTNFTEDKCKSLIYSVKRAFYEISHHDIPQNLAEIFYRDHMYYLIKPMTYSFKRKQQKQLFNFLKKELKNTNHNIKLHYKRKTKFILNLLYNHENIFFLGLYILKPMIKFYLLIRDARK